MALQRRDFTMLAELAGQIAAGRIPLTEIIEEFTSTLETHCGEASTFKRDTFTRHAEKQREIEGMPAAMVRPGDSFTIDGLLLRCDVVNILTATSEVILWTHVDSADEMPVAGHDASLSFVLGALTKV